MIDANQQYEQQRVQLARQAREQACKTDVEFRQTKQRLTRMMYCWGVIALLDRIANLLLGGGSFFVWIAVTAIVLFAVLTFGYLLIVRGSRAASLFMILGGWFSVMVLIRPLLGADVAGWYRLLCAALMLPQISLLVMGAVIALGRRSNAYCNAIRAQLARVEEQIREIKRGHYEIETKE